MNNILLNLGCDQYKLSGFTNVDINPDVSPDLCFDLTFIRKYFEENSVDFIVANHVLEHLNLKDAINLVFDCYRLLKPFRSLLITVPDYSKCFNLPIDLSERIILANSTHKILCNKERLEFIFSKVGFKCFTEITDLNKVPYLLVSDVTNPVPDPWQTSFLALKIS